MMFDYSGDLAELIDETTIEGYMFAEVLEAVEAGRAEWIPPEHPSQEEKW